MRKTCLDNGHSTTFEKNSMPTWSLNVLFSELHLLQNIVSSISELSITF
jgi:hypothetical protein